jgi:hypothetical protein
VGASGWAGTPNYWWSLAQAHIVPSRVGHLGVHAVELSNYGASRHQARVPGIEPGLLVLETSLCPAATRISSCPGKTVEPPRWGFPCGRLRGPGPFPGPLPCCRPPGLPVTARGCAREQNGQHVLFVSLDRVPECHV